MKKDLITIIKKEFKRFFGDRRLFLSSVILPGLLIYVVYSVMGGVLEKNFEPDDTYEPTIYIVNAPESASALYDMAGLKWEKAKTDQIEEKKKEIGEQETDLLVVYPENFDEQVAAYNTVTSTEAAPEIQIYYNSAATESYNIYAGVCELYDAYEQALTNKFDINREGTFDLATQEDTTVQIFSMMVPMLLIMMLMSGCIAVAPDAIAGEKERGTMATLLVTPAKRRNIALGKVISLGVFALLSATSSILGVLLSLPKLMGGAEGELSAAVYSTADYVVLIASAFATVLALVSIFAIISTYAKTIKEAGSISSPIMIVGMVLGITTAIGTETAGTALYCIPIYNSCMLFSGIFSMNYTIQQVLLTIATNIIFTGICVFIMTKMFDSEKIMFAR